MMRLIGILSIHGLLSLSYLNIFISTTLFPVVSAYQINEGCDKELEVLSKCTQEKCYTDLDDYLPDSDITCDSYEYTDLCNLKYDCADCGEFFQALKDCALPNCPDCEDLKCFTENIEVNSCLQKEFFTCQECFAYFEGTDPNQPSCDDIPSLCQASRCCDSCAVVIQAAVDCSWGPTCSTNDAESIECASIPPVSAPLPFGGDNTTFGDDFFGNNDDTFGDDDDTFGDDGVSLECQDLATEFMKCISINLVCLFTSPKCIELGTFEDGGSGDETEDEFTCEGVPQACAEFTCCETCADSARNFIECEANEYNCSETCDDEINTLPGEDDDIVGGTISSSPIAPAPISLPPVTPEPVTPAPVTPLPSTSAPVTTEPIATPSITPNTSPPTMADQPVNKTEVEKENIVTSFNNLDNWVRNIIIGSCAIVGALILFVCVRSCSDSA